MDAAGDHLVAGRVERVAGHHRDADGVRRDAVEVVHGPVDRVDAPRSARSARGPGRPPRRGCRHPAGPRGSPCAATLLTPYPWPSRCRSATSWWTRRRPGPGGPSRTRSPAWRATLSASTTRAWRSGSLIGPPQPGRRDPVDASRQPGSSARGFGQQPDDAAARPRARDGRHRLGGSAPAGQRGALLQAGRPGRRRTPGPRRLSPRGYRQPDPGGRRHRLGVQVVHDLHVVGHEADRRERRRPGRPGP